MTRTRTHRIILLLIGIAATVTAFAIAGQPTTLAQSGGTLSYGARVYGTIAADAPPVSYGFSGSAGDLVIASAETWTGPLDIHLDLVAPNGVILASSSQNMPGSDPTGAVIEVLLPETGVYLLRLSGDNSTGGEFLLTLLGRGPAVTTPLIFGQAVDVSVAQGALSQFFTFEAQDCPTTLIVSDPSQGLPYTFPFVVKVRDQRGYTVARLRGGDSVEDRVTVQPLSGRYEVEVLAADPALSGTIRLLVTCSGDAPGCAGWPGGSAALPVPQVCVPCPTPDDLVPGGGCPPLNLRAVPNPRIPNMVTVSWDAMAGAEGYTVYVRGLLSGGGEVYLTHANWIPGNPLEFSWILPDTGYIGFRFTLEVLAGGAVICTHQTESSLPVEPELPELPCAIRTDRPDVWVRVGPGLGRAVFTFLPTGVDIPVIGQATEDGIAWWQIDKSVIPGGDMVISLWVQQSDVVTVGDCSNVPPGDVPPIIPEGDIPPGGWLPCGSCDTCGHPASECVTSPEGACLWDPATCAPPPPGGDVCYMVTAVVDLGNCSVGASAFLDVRPNCTGGKYLAGTVVDAHTVLVDPGKCILDSWSGCGVSGNSNNVSFVVTSDCTLTAHYRSR